MSENNDFNNGYDSLKDNIEFQENAFNLGHYIGTGRVPPTVSAPGNALPLVIVEFVCSAISLFMAFFTYSVFSDITDKIIVFAIFFVLSGVCLFFGFKYLKKAKRYYKQKTELEKEEIAEDVADELWQRTCPKCGETHDIDYPKCPNCKHNYLE